MFEDVIKGGLKPGMILSGIEDQDSDGNYWYIVFPNKFGELCAVKYKGTGSWGPLRITNSCIWFSNVLIKAIYEPANRGYLFTKDNLIWSLSKGTIKDEYKLSNEEVIDSVLNNLESEETNSEYFY